MTTDVGRGLLLEALQVDVAGDDPSAAWAGKLLASLGAQVRPLEGCGLLRCGDVLVDGPRRSAAATWADSGAMVLTGHEDGPPLPVVGQPGVAARGAALAVELLTALRGSRVGVDGASLLGERAALAGLTRRGRVSPGGACRLLPTTDGWVALNLPRPDDVELLPALVETDVLPDPWSAVAAWAAGLPAQEAAERAQLLGLACGALPGAEQDEQQRFREQPWVWRATGSRPRAAARPRVVDLSGLWAGPLCAHLLGLAGAEVVKVEATGRPDGARAGTPAFFDLLHAGHASVALDFHTAAGRDELVRLLRSADVVIEASRPRALVQLGVHAESLVEQHPGLTWVSVTAYGRTGPWSNRVGFGDDVAVAGGLVAQDADGPLFAGDAIADPLTGLHAAVAALAGLAGGGGLVDLAMRDVAAAAAVSVGEMAPAGLPSPPRARATQGAGPALGADTARLLRP